jgi:hypothetical protein
VIIGENDDADDNNVNNMNYSFDKASGIPTFYGYYHICNISLNTRESYLYTEICHSASSTFPGQEQSPNSPHASLRSC